MDVTAHLWLGESGADDARLDLLHRQVRAQLDDVPELEVAVGRPAATPDGARGVDAATVSTLAVAILGSGGLSALMAAIREWLGPWACSTAVRAVGDLRRRARALGRFP